MSDFTDRLPKRLGSFSEGMLASGEAKMASIQRKQLERAICEAEKRAALLWQKAEKTEGRLARSRLEQAALQADEAAAAMRKKVAELKC